MQWNAAFHAIIWLILLDEMTQIIVWNDANCRMISVEWFYGLLASGQRYPANKGAMRCKTGSWQSFFMMHQERFFHARPPFDEQPSVEYCPFLNAGTAWRMRFKAWRWRARGCSSVFFTWPSAWNKPKFSAETLPKRAVKPSSYSSS